MSTQYNTEPPPTATVLLQTTAGPLTISLFANQTPLSCRNFLQHVLDGYYNNNIFHRVSSAFVIQTGDPTGTGEGGENIYEDRSLERYDEHWARLLGRENGEKIVFGDEIHSRLKFNRRGLVGLAKGGGAGGDGYGSQFFITLGDCRAELDGKCTMIGRVEGEGIYNVVKISEGEVVEGTERPVYPEKIISAEILQMPKGEAWDRMQKREIIAKRVAEEPIKKKAPKKKAGKALLSFGGDDEGDSPGVVVRPKKAKFNPALIDAGDAVSDSKARMNGTASKEHTSPTSPQQNKRPASPKPFKPQPQIPQKRKASPPTTISSTISKSPSPNQQRRKPSFHDPTTQLPLRDPESPSRSPTPTDHYKRRSPSTSKPTTSSLQAEIAALKASMRRDVTAPTEAKTKKSALESLIPATSIRGRKRPKPGDLNASGAAKSEANALKMLNAFKARLDNADVNSNTTQDTRQPETGKSISSSTSNSNSNPKTNGTTYPPAPTNEPDEEAQLCDLHFIANCQSCSSWDRPILSSADQAENSDDDDRNWMSHSLSFAKDRLGKDLTWKKKNEEDLVVIDPREKEKEVLGKNTDWKGKGKERDRNRDRGWR